jgi:light-regulated signal transduction histidine kinase (bacteriophytochrome)
MAFAHDLPQRQPDVDWGKIAGALVIRTEGTPSLQIAFLRNSNASTVNWAGAPEKDVSFDDEKPKLHPRHSFEAYQVLSRDNAIEWSSGDVEVVS